MDIEVEKVVGNYPDNILSSIWSDSLIDIDSKKRILWAYKENVCGKAHLWILKEKTTGAYIGCSVLLPRYFFVNGKKILGAIIADTGVKKRYRTLGPALKLHKEIIKGSQDFRLIIAFPNKVSEPVIKMVGFKKAKNLFRNIKITKGIIALEKKIKSPLISKLLFPSVPIIDLGLKLLDFRVASSKRFTGSHVKTFDKRFDEIGERFSRKFDFIIYKSSDYLNWRYRKHPDKDYNIYVVHERDSLNLLGYIIYYIKDKIVYVDDFLWLEESFKLENLLSLFVSNMRKRGIRGIFFTYMDNSLIQKTLKKMRFFRTEYTSSIMYFSRDEYLNKIFPHLMRNAFIVSGDSDI